MFEIVAVSGLPPLKSISISASAEQAVRTARVECAITGDGLPVMPGQAVTVTAGGEPVLTGYVRDVDTGYDENDRTLGVGLCSRTVDACECSVDHPTGEVLKKNLVEIGRALDGQGIGIEDDGTAFPVEDSHKVLQGETLFETIERRARKRGALLYDTPGGKLKIATRPEGMHKGRLIGGVNIIASGRPSASFTEAGRYRMTKVRGQTTRGTGRQHLRAEAISADAGVSRDRIRIVPHEGLATPETLKRRAAWHARRAAGNSVTASIPVAGWRDEGGRLWSVNWLVEIRDTKLGLEGIMVIKSVTFTQDESGTRAVLQVADPRALGGETPRGKHISSYAAPGAADGDYQDE